MSNLISTQQNLRIESKPIVVHCNWTGKHIEDEYGNLHCQLKDPGMPDFWTDDYGQVVGCPDGAAHLVPNTRTCVHLLEEPAPCNLFSIDWLKQLDWRPTLYTVGRIPPVIASRVGLNVTLAWDIVGPIEDCHNRPTCIEQRNKWVYALHPLIFDDKPDETHDHIYVGVWPD